MNTTEYLDRLLLKFSNTFNIYKPYRIGGKEYPAYAYYHSHNEKYVLVQEANMWTMDSYEHVVFMEYDFLTGEAVEDAFRLISDVMEEKLVRKGQKYPEKNHMSSILTVIILTQKPIDVKLKKKLKRFRFDKGYKFHMRGYSRGRIFAISMDDKNICMSSAEKDMKASFQKAFKDVEEGREGFDAVCEKQGVSPYRQDTDNIVL